MIFAPVTKKQCTEFGQVAAGVLLLVALYRREWHFVSGAFIVLLVNMIAPVLFYPFAWSWFALAKILAEINMRVLLTLLFCLMVMPVGLWRKLRRRDSLRLRQFRQGSDSVLETREKSYKKEDLLHTF